MLTSVKQARNVRSGCPIDLKYRAIFFSCRDRDNNHSFPWFSSRFVGGWVGDICQRRECWLLLLPVQETTSCQNLIGVGPISKIPSNHVKKELEEKLGDVNKGRLTPERGKTVAVHVNQSREKNSYRECLWLSTTIVAPRLPVLLS